MHSIRQVLFSPHSNFFFNWKMPPSKNPDLQLLKKPGGFSHTGQWHSWTYMAITGWNRIQFLLYTGHASPGTQPHCPPLPAVLRPVLVGITFASPCLPTMGCFYHLIKKIILLHNFFKFLRASSLHHPSFPCIICCSHYYFITMKGRQEGSPPFQEF